MFKRKTPYYSNDELNAAVERLERLEKLRDKAQQLQVIKKGTSDGDKYQKLYEGYLSNTRTAQLYLDHMQIKETD